MTFDTDFDDAPLPVTVAWKQNGRWTKVHTTNDNTVTFCGITIPGFRDVEDSDSSSAQGRCKACTNHRQK